jgi:hypothetical protein
LKLLEKISVIHECFSIHEPHSARICRVWSTVRWTNEQIRLSRVYLRVESQQKSGIGHSNIPVGIFRRYFVYRGLLTIETNAWRNIHSSEDLHPTSQLRAVTNPPKFKKVANVVGNCYSDIDSVIQTGESIPTERYRAPNRNLSQYPSHLDYVDNSSCDHTVQARNCRESTVTAVPYCSASTEVKWHCRRTDWVDLFFAIEQESLSGRLKKGSMIHDCEIQYIKFTEMINTLQIFTKESVPCGGCKVWAIWWMISTDRKKNSGIFSSTLARARDFWGQKKRPWLFSQLAASYLEDWCVVSDSSRVGWDSLKLLHDKRLLEWRTCYLYRGMSSEAKWLCRETKTVSWYSSWTQQVVG